MKKFEVKEVNGGLELFVEGQKALSLIEKEKDVELQVAPYVITSNNINIRLKDKNFSDDNGTELETLGCIIDVFEDFLEEKGVSIDNDERTGDEGEAIIYGSDYGYLENMIRNALGIHEMSI